MENLKSLAYVRPSLKILSVPMFDLGEVGKHLPDPVWTLAGKRIKQKGLRSKFAGRTGK